MAFTSGSNNSHFASSLPTELISLIIAEVADLASSDLQFSDALRKCLHVSRVFYALSSKYIFPDLFSVVTFRRRRKLVDGERLRSFYAILSENPTLEQYIKELRIGHDYGHGMVLPYAVDIVAFVIQALPHLESLTFSADMSAWAYFSQPLATTLLDTFTSQRLTSLRLHSIAGVPPEVFCYFRNLKELEVRYVTLSSEQFSETLSSARPHPCPKLAYLCFSFATDVSLLLMQCATTPYPVLDLSQLGALNAHVADIDAARATAMIFSVSFRYLHTVSLDLGQEIAATFPGDMDLSQLNFLKTIQFNCSIQQYRDDFMGDVVLLLNTVSVRNSISVIHFNIVYKDDYHTLHALEGILDGWWRELDDALARPIFHCLKAVKFYMKQRTRGTPDPECNNTWVDTLWNLVRQYMPLLCSSPNIITTFHSLEIIYM
ncbi:hypothetical protein BDQ17DRAFT_1351921 [Cyathus striatus]|nr:hypothetical protein BDQ17DRAFT_1351921 [Cyathus striatus]